MTQRAEWRYNGGGSGGAGGARAAMGLPDLAVTTLHDVLADADRILARSDLPLLVDADTGFGSWLNIARAAREFCRIGAAGMHLEDQSGAKRCRHRPNKTLAPAKAGIHLGVGVFAEFCGGFGFWGFIVRAMDSGFRRNDEGG